MLWHHSRGFSQNFWRFTLRIPLFSLFAQRSPCLTTSHIYARTCHSHCKMKRLHSLSKILVNKYFQVTGAILLRWFSLIKKKHALQPQLLRSNSKNLKIINGRIFEDKYAVHLISPFMHYICCATFPIYIGLSCVLKIQKTG